MGIFEFWGATGSPLVRNAVRVIIKVALTFFEGSYCMLARLKSAGLLAIILAIVFPIALLLLDFKPVIAVMSVVAVIGFFTVVFVMIIGSEEDHYPKSAEESAAVKAWKQRLAVNAGETSEE